MCLTDADVGRIKRGKESGDHDCARAGPEPGRLKLGLVRLTGSQPSFDKSSIVE